MSKVKKSTKKFAQKKLKGVIKHKKKHPGSHKRSGSDSTAAHHGQQQEHKRPGAKKLADMELDEFLDGGFEEAAEDSSEEQQGASAGSSDDPDSAAMSDDSGDLDDDTDLKQFSQGSSDDEQTPAAAGHASDDDVEDESSSDDADAAIAAGPEAAAVAADNTRLKGAIGRHKQQLEALKTKDPEFYAYLEATDAGLLGFGDEDEADEDFEDLSESSDDAEDDDKQPVAAAAAGKGKAAAAVGPTKAKVVAEHETEDDDEEPASEAEDAAAAEASTSGVHVSSSMVEGWCTAALEKASLGAMMQLIKAYRVACHYGDTEQQMTSTLTISSGAVFNKVMLFMLKEADGIFRRMLGLQPDSSSAAAAAGSGSKASGVLLAEQVTKAPRWRKVEPLVKSYLGNSLHLLSSMTQPAMTAYTLRRLRPSVAFLGPFPRLTKKLLKLALELFGSGEKENAPRLQALLLVRQMGVVLPPPALQTCLRGAYRAYAANAKFVSPASLPALAFMAAGVVELSVLDLNVTYQVGFVAIRELAVLLRNALSQKTQDAHKEVYCWQTLNCLELWVKVLSAAAVKGSALQPLVYPLTQLLLGAARLVPTPRYFPIRLRLVRAVNKLAQATGVYVPVSPLLLEMLQWSELKRTPSGGAGAPPDMLLLLRLNKTQLKMASLQEDVVHQVLELLADHLRQWATSVAFPEAAHLAVVALRSFIKGCAVERFRRATKQLLDAVERNSVYVGAARDNVTFAPQDIAAAGRFLSEDRDVTKSPLIQFATQLLQKAAARMAMRSNATTQEVVLGSDAGSRRSNKRQRAAAEDDSSSCGDDHDDHDDDDDDSDDSDEQQQGDMGLLLAAKASEDEQDDEEVADAAKKHIRQREKRLKRAAAAAGAGGQADVGADQLEEYQLSEEENSADEGSEDDDASGEGLRLVADHRVADTNDSRRGGKRHQRQQQRKPAQKGQLHKQRQGKHKQGKQQGCR